MKRLNVKKDISTDFSALMLEGERVLLVPITDAFADEIFAEFTTNIPVTTQNALFSRHLGY